MRTSKPRYAVGDKVWVSLEKVFKATVEEEPEYDERREEWTVDVLLEEGEDEYRTRFAYDFQLTPRS